MPCNCSDERSCEAQTIFPASRDTAIVNSLQAHTHTYTQTKAVSCFLLGKENTPREKIVFGKQAAAAQV